MKHSLYTCCRCGKEQRMAAETDDVPLGWARVSYYRDFIETIEGDKQLQHQSLTTHACGGCCSDVYAFLDKVTAVDQSFDDGGAS